jgi:cytochrome bd-type quinol oxidase subunit 2
MINPLDYLYYKIYVAWSYISGGGKPGNNMPAIGLLLLSNIITGYVLIYKSFSETFGILSAIIVVIFCAIYFNLKKEDEILKKYENESQKSQIIGAIAVISYSIISIVSFICVLLYYAKNR